MSKYGHVRKINGVLTRFKNLVKGGLSEFREWSIGIWGMVYENLKIQTGYKRRRHANLELGFFT